MRYSLLLLVVLLLLALGIRYIVDPERISENPAKDLHDMELRDPDLAEALNKADDGDVAELSDWINRADLLTREHLATLLWAMVLDPKNQHKTDATLSWKYRNRFRPFLEISTGNEHLDTEIDNNLAYILVTGTPSPSEDDIRLVTSVEQRLEHKAKDTNDATLEDTVGCIDFVGKHFDKAKDDFKTALAYLTQNHEPDTADLEALEKRRMEAADFNAQYLVKHPDGGVAADLKPLPPDPDDAHAEPRTTAAAADSSPPSASASGAASSSTAGSASAGHDPQPTPAPGSGSASAPASPAAAHDAAPARDGAAAPAQSTPSVHPHGEESTNL